MDIGTFFDQSFVLFVGFFLAMIFLQEWLHRHIQEFAFGLTGNPGCALRALFYLLMPGIYLHEFSHYLMAIILRVRVKKFDVGIGRTYSGQQQISLGSVQIARAGAIRESLIGAAPFLMGIGAILLIAYWGFGLTADAAVSLELIMARVSEHIYNWTTWLLFYLIFAVSTAMIPSESDREPWGFVLAVAGILVVILFLLGWKPRVTQDLVLIARQVLGVLTFALAIAAVVNFVVAVALWILERTMERISGRHVEYRVKRKE